MTKAQQLEALVHNHTFGVNPYQDQLIEEVRAQHATIIELNAQLVAEAARTANEKLRADQMSQQHSTQAELNSEARNDLAQARAKILELEQGKCLLQIAEPADNQVETLIATLRERMKYSHARHGHASRFVELKLEDAQKIESILCIAQRAAAPQAVQPAVPDSAVREVMDMVSDWSMKDHAAGEATLDAHNPDATNKEHEYATFCVSESRAAWAAIESKLRAMITAAPAHPAEGVPAAMAGPGILFHRERATQPAAQELDANALSKSFREYLSVSEHIEASGPAMDSIATDLTRIVLAEVEVSAVIARRHSCNASGQAGEDIAKIRAAAIAAQAKQGV